MIYGKWTVLREGKRYSTCRCKCGTEKEVRTKYLKGGVSKGCFACRDNRWKKESAKERFYRLHLKKYEGTEGCWVFEGSTNSGYGSVMYEGKVRIAHRASWMYFNGQIPDKMKICHTCDNTLCINPRHLFLGTQADNMKDMRKKGRSNYLKGEKHPSAILKEEQVPGIFEMYHGKKMSQQAISHIVGVAQGIVSKVLNRSHHLTRGYGV